MHYVIAFTVILLAFIGPMHGRELAAKHFADGQDSVGEFVDHAVMVRPFIRTDLDSTTLGKPTRSCSTLPSSKPCGLQPFWPSTVLAFKAFSTPASQSTSFQETLSITSNFESGNIEVVSVRGNTVDLKIRQEPYTDWDKKRHAQWFYFKVANARGKDCSLRILNAGQCSYAPGWKGYRAVCSYDHEHWFRTPTTYSEKDGIMTINIKPTKDVFWCAYFAPYSYERHQKLIANAGDALGTRIKSIGKTLDGRDIDLIMVGSGKVRVWIQARQHPGETQAEFWMEGFLGRLLDPDDALARQLQYLCTWYIIPNVNPDGSVRGHLRTNAAGANLNREWADTGSYRAPTLERSPEVYWILKEMDTIGVDFFMDVHADEERPHNFFACTQGAPNWNNQFAKILQTLGETYQKVNPDFGNLAYNYDNDEVGKGVQCIGSDAVSIRFDCFAVTLEMPYKDCFDTPEPTCGWSPTRCAKLGASFLDAFGAIVHDLRRNFPVDEASLPDWVKPGYTCPPQEECSWKPRRT